MRAAELNRRHSWIALKSIADRTSAPRPLLADSAFETTGPHVLLVFEGGMREYDASIMLARV